MATSADLGLLEAAARDCLEPAVFAYAASGGGDERTLTANARAWESIMLRPRVLRDVTSVQTTTTVLGQSLSMPIMVAPTAGHALFSADAETGMARAASGAGTVMTVSMMSSTAIEDIAKAVPEARLWMHITMLADRGRTRAICERARAAGCQAIVLTVDCPVGAPRPRSEQYGPVALAGAPLPNVTLPGDPVGGELAAMVAGFDKAVTFDDIATVSGWADGLPVVVKGLVRGDDALLCAQAGAAAVVVSNHGGRQLDQCIPTAMALPEVVEAVGGQLEVLVDGGIRRGVHVLAALALGATATLVGRLPVYGLATGGHGGARNVLAQLREELATAMALCGVNTLAELSPDLLRLP